MRYTPLAAAAAFTLLAAQAQAGGYAGIALGQASIDDTVTQSGTSAGIDENATGWKIFGGYGFTDNLGVEAGWADLGDMNEGGVVDTETEGFYAAGVGRFPIGDSGLSVHGKLGLYAWDQDIAISGGTVSHDGIDFMYGIGAKYLVNDLLGVQFDWERYNTETDADLISVGITLNF
ncbi:outer membrane beta-barrel protein [Thiohalobacter sp.]|uniref:outer membrane beta-barrel protein n=1 Tax=Thiohalobacter sp. TaxID=2025948 RepID=UPI00263416A4|nr:outer membrane beta-barrel protein [Thiohalobacter sp.]